MSFDSLIAVAAFVLAVYAIAPRPRQLAFWLRCTWLEWMIVILALVIIHLLLLFPSHLVIQCIASPAHLEPNQLAYLVLLGAIICIVILRSQSRIPVRNLPKLREYVQQLLALEEFRALAPLLGAQMDALVRIADEERLSDNDRLTPHSSYILQSALTHPGFIHAIARHYPDFGIRAMKLEHHEYEFTDGFLRAMLGRESSLLASEIKQNQNVASDGGFRLDPRNRLLHSLFHDASFAERRAVYRPIGDAMLGELHALAREGANDPYVWDMDQSFREREQFRLPLFVGLRFFEIMIWCSLRQGIRWHMWLYYFPHFTKAICHNCDRHPDGYYETTEWPSRYCYLLYEMIHGLAAWATSVTHDAINAAIPPLVSTLGDHQNDSIPKSSIIAMGECLDTIVRSETIPIRFQKALLGTAVRTFYMLRPCANVERYAEVTLNVLMHPRSPEYVTRITEVVEDMDTFHYNRSHIDEIEERVRSLPDLEKTI